MDRKSGEGTVCTRSLFNGDKKNKHHMTNESYCLRKQKGRSQIAGMDGGRVTFLILRLGMLSIRLKRVNACRLYKDREI